MTYVGVYAGNRVADVVAFESWLGREVNSVAVHTGRASWWDWDNSIDWAIRNWRPLDRDVTLSVPMFANEGNLASAAKGDYNAHYLTAAKKLLAAYGDQEVIYLRVGEEFNGGWMPWAAKGREADFVDAYRQFVTAFRSVSDKFKFEWNVANGDFGVDPAKAYPGDAYVDVIGMDFYYDLRWDNPDPLKAWNYHVIRKYGLQWLENFAEAHDKPTAYSEWGVMSGDAGPYIEKAAQWFEDHDVVYQNYWNTNSAFDGKLSDNQYPDAAAAFIEKFGEAGIPPVVIPELPDVTPVHNLGDDIYVATRASDVFVESSGGGVDTVQASVSYVLGANLENLTLTGGGAINGTGNTLDNLIIGTKAANSLWGLGGNDRLEGRGGADTLHGGAGDDTYVLVAGTEKVIELAGEGTDTVISGVTYTLSANLENLVLVNGGKAGGFGNELANQITGTGAANRIEGRGGDDILKGLGGNDILVGGRGNDRLAGGGGVDAFVFSRGDGRDIIEDFGLGGRDVLDLSAFKSGSGFGAKLTAVGADTIISFSSGETIHLLGVSPNELFQTASGYAHL